jgi:hypothetical protein
MQEISNKTTASSQLHVGSFFGLLFDTEDECDVSPEHRLTFTGLHGVISRKTDLFTVTAAKTSNPIIILVLQFIHHSHSRSMMAFKLNCSM